MRRLAQFMRLLASVCVCVRLLASVCVCVRLSRVCMRLCASARVCVRLCASARVCVRLYASVCVSRLCASRVGRLISRRSSYLASVVLSRVCVRLLVNSCGNWLILCVCLRRSSFKEFKGGGGNWLRRSGFAVCLASYYPLAVFCERLHSFYFLILI